MNTTPVTFGKLIELARRRRDLRQQDLAEAVGVSRQLVSRWESNDSYPDARQIRLIIEATGEYGLIEWFTSEDDGVYVRDSDSAGQDCILQSA